MWQLLLLLPHMLLLLLLLIPIIFVMIQLLLPRFLLRLLVLLKQQHQDSNAILDMMKQIQNRKNDPPCHRDAPGEALR